MLPKLSSQTRMTPIVVLLTSLTVCETFLYGGLYHGISSLRIILKEEGVYGYLCTRNSTNTTLCNEQDNAFDLAYTLANLGFLGAFPFGLLLDKYDVYRTKWLTILLYFCGDLCLAFTQPGRDFLLLIGMILIGFAGVQVVVSNTKVSFFGKRYKGLVCGLIAGSYDSAAVNFQLMKNIRGAGPSFMSIMIAHAIFGAVLMTITTILYQAVKGQISEKSTTNIDKEMQLSEDASSPSTKTVSNNPHPSDSFQNFHLRITFREKSRLYLFISHLYFGVINSVIYIHLIGIINIAAQILSGGDEAADKRFGSIMSYCLMFALIVSPLPGLIYDIGCKVLLKIFGNNEHLKQYSLAIPTSLTILLCVSGVSVLAFSQNTDTLYFVCIITLISRSFVGLSVTLFLIDNFPPEKFGILIGMIFILISISLQTLFLLSSWTLNVKSVLPANLFLTILGITTVVHPIGLCLVKMKTS